MTWNPRFLAYCRAAGFSPAAMLARDMALYPGGKMAGFSLWIQARWAEWRKLQGLHRDDPIGEVEHRAFDAWLEAR